MVNGFPTPYISLPFSIVLLIQNLLTIIIIRRTPKLHTHANIVVASIAGGDIYLALVCITSGIVYLPGVRNTKLNNALLEASMCGAGYSSLLLSVSQLGLIAIDRYTYIVYPLYYMARITKRRIYKTIACFWLVGIVYGLVPLFVYRNASDYNICLITRPPFEYIAVPIVLYQVEVILIFVCYFIIARLAFQRKKASRVRQLGFNGGISSREAFITGRTAAWRSVKFFATMYGIFFACTYPAVLAILINSVDSFPLSVFVPLMFLFFMHSMFNFFAYLNMNKDFCLGFKHLFMRKIRNNRN
ncbi:unnamed protein product [Candidula unifasciata]|uniref:G-protein coupled receptors family 1 profile domain-containing protein n=1 Tax=Candidula unifasciata TaxID=100452 RepID=A0A8S3Z001_9EUPU|nr:unnamed protein product [Candidula unifasciata]